MWVGDWQTTCVIILLATFLKSFFLFTPLNYYIGKSFNLSQGIRITKAGKGSIHPSKLSIKLSTINLTQIDICRAATDPKTHGSDRFADQSHGSDHFSDQQKNLKKKKERQINISLVFLFINTFKLLN